MTTIWRYMDLWKFKSILEKKALFFSKVAKQTDKLEGMYPLMAKINRAKQFIHLPEEQQSYALHNQEVNDQQSTNEIILSCWHINENENMRMWDEYIGSREGEGIAIQTTKEALKNSFTAFSHPNLIEIKEVKYINRTTFSGHSSNERMNVFFQKDKSFEWENELRCAIDVLDRPSRDDPGGDWDARHLFLGEPYPIGYFVPIEVDKLIERLVVSPRASDHFRTNVESLCHTYRFNKPIEDSKLRSGA